MQKKKMTYEARMESGYRILKSAILNRSNNLENRTPERVVARRIASIWRRRLNLCWKCF